MVGRIELPATIVEAAVSYSRTTNVSPRLAEQATQPFRERRLLDRICRLTQLGPAAVASPREACWDRGRRRRAQAWETYRAAGSEAAAAEFAEEPAGAGNCTFGPSARSSRLRPRNRRTQLLAAFSNSCRLPPS